MTKGEVLAQVGSRQIRPDAYDLNGGGTETYTLERQGDAWEMFYSERGLKTGKRSFAAESDALEDLLVRLTSDPTVKLA